MPMKDLAQEYFNLSNHLQTAIHYSRLILNGLEKQTTL